MGISGAEPVTADIDKLDIAYGRFFSNPENDNAARVAFIGMDVVNKIGATAVMRDPRRALARAGTPSATSPD